MREGINRASRIALAVLSSLAVLPFVVVYGRWGLGGALPFQETDEGVGAHIFQLAIVLILPTGIVFVTTADWKRPLLAVQPLALPLLSLSVAFAALYFGEHYF